jgi:creatinine amidohydrolase/Fe(II)-dependent formamide hydrolase-like protein
MDFPGFSLPSLYNEESALGIIVQDLVEKFKRQGFKVVVLVSGHGGQNHWITLTRIARERTIPGEFVVLHAFGLRPQDDYTGGHAEKGETDFMLAYYPATVDLGALPPPAEPLRNMDYGVLDNLTCMGQPTENFTVRSQQDPRTSSGEAGQAAHNDSVRRLAQLVNETTKTMAAQEWPWF